MALAKRIFLFLAVNILVMLTVSFILNFFQVQPYLQAKGIDYKSLMIFCLIWGMVGAFISLLLSKVMAKWMMGVKTVDALNCSIQEKNLVNLVQNLSRKAGLSAVPEIGIFESEELNAFATGPTQRFSLVAVSSGLLKKMNSDELEGVLAHEIAHIANGDMVTMTLLQGVINAFVMFLARAIAFAISQVKTSDSEESSSEGFSQMTYFITTFVLEMIFMVLGSIVVAAFSRYREFKADGGGAQLAGKAKMVAALKVLKNHYETTEDTENKQNGAVRALMISTRGSSWLHIFASHPPLDKRIEKLNESR